MRLDKQSIMFVKPLVGAIFLLLSLSTFANTVTYQLNGFVNGVDAPLQGGSIQVGDLVSGSFQADTVAVVVQDANSQAKYKTNNLLLQIGSSYSATSAGVVTVLNNWGALRDINKVQFDFTSGYGLGGSPINELLPDYFVSQFNNSTGSVALPFNLDVSGSSSYLRFNRNDNAEIHFVITNFSVVPTPVPINSAVWLFGFGVLSFLGLRRKVTEGFIL